MEPTSRLTRRINEDFDADEAELVAAALDELDLDQRAQAAIVRSSAGDLGRFDRALQEARIDWRDVLVMAGLAHEHRRVRLDGYLGPVEGPS